MNVGTLNAFLSLDSSKFDSGLQNALRAVDAVGRRMERIGKLADKGLKEIGRIFTEAAKYDREVAAGVKEVQNAYNTLAVEIARLLMPTLKSAANFATNVVNAFRSMSPHARELVTHFAGIAVAGLGIASVAGKVGGLVGSLAGMAAAVLPMLPVILGVAAALAGLIAVTVLLHKAWRENWGGIQEKTRAVLEFVQKAFQIVVGNIGAQLSALAKTFIMLADQALRVVEIFGRLAPGGGAIAKLATSMREGLGHIAEFVFSPGSVSELLSQASDVAGQVKDAFVDELQMIMKELGLDDAFAKIKGLLGKSNALPMLMQDAGVEMKEVAENIAPSMVEWRKELVESTLVIQRLNGAHEKARLEAEKQAAAARVARRVAEGRSADGSSSLGNLTGGMGSTINAGIQGAAAGGPIGAIAGIVTDLLSHSKQFIELFGAVSDVFALLADALGTFIAPLIPVVNVLGNVFKSVAPAFGALLNMLMMIANPILILATIGLPIFFYAVKYLGLGVLYVARAISGVWNGIVSGVQKLLYGLGDIFKDVGPIHDGLYLLAAGLQKMKDTTNYDENIKTLSDLTLEAATGSINKNTEAHEEQAKVLERVNEELTNIPSGYKVALAQFHAMDSGAAQAVQSGTMTLGAAGIETQRAGSTFVTVNIEGSILAEKDVDNAITRIMKLRASNQLGSPTFPGGSF